MIDWLQPMALVGLAAVAGPLLVHLLRRRPAQPLSFPSLRFIVVATTRSVRFRAPADASLLLLRIAIVGLSAVALAQPYLFSPGRRHAMEMRISRAIVIDSRVSGSGPAKEAIAAAQLGTNAALTFSSPSLKDGLADAVHALGDTPASRREIVVISDFRHGVLSSADIVAVPAGIGLRFITLHSSSTVAEFAGDSTMAGPGIPSRVERIALTPTSTAVLWSATTDRSGGLRLDTAPSRAAVLLRGVAAVGVPAPDLAQPIALVFGRGSRSPEEKLTSWMLQTVLRMRRDGQLIEAARAHAVDGKGNQLGGVPVARNAPEAVVVAAFRSGTELVLAVAGEPEDFLSTVTLHSALVARRGPPAWSDQEVARIPQSQLAAWTRQPATPGLRNMRPPSPGDAQLVWAIVLVLLAAETWIRSRHHRTAGSRYADAA
jgi:hypothetical protein